MATLFTKIIEGEIPSHKIYEDDKTFAFLDIHPFSEGHTLVVPKQEIESFERMHPDDFKDLMGVVHTIAKKQREIYDSRIVQMALGYDVPHVHIHVFPADSMRVVSDALCDPNQASAEPDHEELTKVRNKLTFK